MRWHVSMVTLGALGVLALSHWSEAQSPNGNNGKGWINLNACGDAQKKASVEQMFLGDTAARIKLWGSQSLTVKPSGSAGEVAEGYFDYAIQFDPEQAPVPISSFGSSQEEKDQLSERILHSIGVSCLGTRDAVVYLGFAINGSQRDYIFIGLRIGRRFVRPVLLGTSEYGVLSIDPTERDAFDIWSGGSEAAAMGMGARTRFQITRFRWSNESGGASIKKEATTYSRNMYPGEVLYKGYGSMRIGDPRIKIMKTY
jgi:hypothetical protein